MAETGKFGRVQGLRWGAAGKGWRGRGGSGPQQEERLKPCRGFGTYGGPWKGLRRGVKSFLCFRTITDCGAENYWRKQDHVGDGSDLDQSAGSGGLTSLSVAKLLQV